MSLKKQIKELKSDLFTNSEKLEKLRRNAKVGKLEEMEAEIDMYKNELNRMRSMIKLNVASVDQDTEGQDSIMIYNQKLETRNANLNLMVKSASNSAHLIETKNNNYSCFTSNGNLGQAE